MKKIDRRNFLTLCKSAGFISLFPFGTPLFLTNTIKLKTAYSGNRDRQDSLYWPTNIQEHPSLAIDINGNPWVAVLERDIYNKKIKVFCYSKNEMYQVAEIKPEGITGISAPSICQYKNSMILTFALEKNDKWDIAYSFIDIYLAKKNQIYNIISHSNKVNIGPVIASVKDNAHILWESSVDGKRGIYACLVTRNYCTKPLRLTDPKFNSYNPTIVAMPDGQLFAAWDSVRRSCADIYGSWYKNGKWLNEFKLTSDGRIEKHPYVTNRGNEIWMCWEAHSYLHNYSNNLTEQRIVVAKLQGEKLYMPRDLFEYVSPDTHVDSENTDTPWIAYYEKNPERKYNLVRPRIAFDRNGSLWVSAREFMGKRQSGSKPVLWNYTGDSWSDKILILNQQGKRQPVEIAFAENNGYAVYQYDDLPAGGGGYQGIEMNWKSGIGISELPVNSQKADLLTKQLEMPFSDFSLKEKTDLINADFERQKVNFNNENLFLFFGDLHNHTDISVCRRSWNPTPKDAYEICRDIEKLDFCAITDHGYNFDPEQWDFLKEQVRCNQDDDTFITFLAEEWTSQGHPPNAPKEQQGYGHHNLIFLDPYFPHFYDSYDGDINPEMLWKELQKDHADFIFIPHQIADMGTNIPKDWKYVNEHFQPVAEIFQGRESYEYLGCPRQAPHGAKFCGHYMQDVWEQGNIIGVIASPDHWGGIGKAAVWAKDLSRESLFEAIRARHTYGTSGTKIGLSFCTQKAFMGDKVPLSSIPDYKFQIKAVAFTNIVEVVIFRNNKIVYREVPDEKEISLEWEDHKPFKENSWYYSRIHCADNEIAWSSPIWFVA
jgi:hypothetical protein